jgi:CarboxypepD_reg-like domain/TonB-dependent Receptor Plug Domain
LKLRPLYLVLLTFIYLLIEDNLSAQSDKAVSDSVYITAEELIHQLENKFNLHIYYKNEWFLNKKITSGVLKESLQQCLVRLKNLGECDFLVIDSTTFIFIPYEEGITRSVTSLRDDYLVIGKMSEYGKYSTANFSGKIFDGKTGNPLFGAIVSVNTNKIGTTTDRNGNFSLPLSVGEYEIKMSYIGYEDDYIKIKLVSDGKYNHELFEYSVKLDEVVILADRADHNISRTQMSIIKLDAKTIRQLPVSIGEADIIKSVSLLPGVQSVGEFGAGFLVRGGSADQNLILIEGVPVFNTSHVFGLTSVINSDGINSVTLLKAGIPVKYGERVSSVMDIRLGFEKEKFITKGGLGLLNSRLNVEIPIIKNKVNLLLGGRSSYSNWLLHKIPDTDLMNSSAGFYDLNGLLTVNITKKSKLTMFGYYSYDKFNFSGNNKYNYSNTLASVRWNQIISGKLYTTLIAGFSSYNYQASEDDSIQKAEGYRIESSIRYKSVKWNFTWLPNNIQSINFGINGIYYNISPGKLSPYSSESLINPLTVSRENALEMAIYAGDEITLSPVISAEVGVRYSNYRLLGPGIAYQFYENLPRTPESILDTLVYRKGETICKYGGLEPRLAFRYSLSGSSSLKLSYSRINQYINLICNTAVLSPSDVWKLSSLNLKPLMADQYAIGYFKNLKNNSFETSVEFYYKKMNNVVEYRNGAKILINPLIECDLLNATGYNYGIELYAKKNSGRLTGWISYTFSKSLRQTNGTFEQDQVNGNNRFMSNYDKPHNLIVMTNYNLSRRWHFSGTFVYNTGRPVTLPEFKYNYQGNQIIYYSDRNKYRLPDYHRLDISVTLDESLRVKKKWKGSWTLSIINLYGRKNAYSVFYKKEVPVAGNNYKMFSLYKLYIIGKPLPTLTYNFIF